MSKQSLATKYRPQVFDDIIEQNAVKKILQNQLKNQTFQNAYLFCGPAGDGKALPMNTDILTINGYKKMKDIVKGDKLIDGNGYRTKVIGIYPQGIRPTYKIIFNDNTSCLCSDDHLWKVKYKENWEVLNTQQLLKIYQDHYVYIPVPIIFGFEPLLPIPDMNMDLSNGVGDKYKYASLGIRVNILNIIKHQYKNSINKDNNFITVDNDKLSNDLGFIIRSLGGVDTITYLEGTDEYEHCYQLPKNNVQRYITDIMYVGEYECQCIKVDSDDHTFIINDCIVTHNTTTARIFANELNQHKGSIIELDAASHNGIDDIRNIINQAKTQSITGEYKVFLLDECFTPDIEILTEKGFIKFENLSKDIKVAQWEDGFIKFVKPIRYIEKEYKGAIYNVNNIKMTPNHVIPLQYKNEIREEYIKDVKFTTYKSIITSGTTNEGKDKVGDWAKLAVICQYATLYSQDYQYTKYCFKYDLMLLDILHTLNIKYDANDNRILFYIPRVIDIPQYLDLNYTSQAAKELIELNKQYNADLKFKGKYLDYYIALSVIAGYQVRVENDCLKLSDETTINCCDIQKIEQQYEGKVYCVEVPSHKIIVKSKGFIMVNGNCHALSNQAWQALLKIIEEPPAKTMFLMCTTDPQKIPNTILSRIQRYDFKRVSYNGIYNRLKYILQQENYGNIDEQTEKSLSYIAKLADGGMRDAITHLDKCLSYGKLNLKNTVRILGTTNYDMMIKLTDYILSNDRVNMIACIEKIYGVGRDMKTFIKQYMVFLLDVEKYNLLQNFQYIQIPETEEYKQWLNNNKNISHILEVIIDLNANIAYSAYPKADMEIALLKCIK